MYQGAMRFALSLKLLKFFWYSLSFLGLWGLVNNAGIHIQSPIDWQPLDNFKRIADVNLWGMIDVTKTFLPLVKKARGRVVNFSSTAGKLQNIKWILFCTRCYWWLSSKTNQHEHIDRQVKFEKGRPFAMYFTVSYILPFQGRLVTKYWYTSVRIVHSADQAH